VWCGSVVRPAPAFHGDGATAGRSAVSIPDINAPPIADPEFRFGGGSDFGFKNPSASSTYPQPVHNHP
jgi:hypothetical protein